VSDEERARRLEHAARLYDEIATELDAAAAHARVAAQHFRNAEIPRAAAHAWATHGHVLRADELLAAQAREHAQRSRPVA
jgi:hypothetical protein